MTVSSLSLIYVQVEYVLASFQNFMLVTFLILLFSNLFFHVPARLSATFAVRDSLLLSSTFARLFSKFRSVDSSSYYFQ